MSWNTGAGCAAVFGLARMSLWWSAYGGASTFSHLQSCGLLMLPILRWVFFGRQKKFRSAGFCGVLMGQWRRREYFESIEKACKFGRGRLCGGHVHAPFCAHIAARTSKTPQHSRGGMRELDAITSSLEAAPAEASHPPNLRKHVDSQVIACILLRTRQHTQL